MAAYEPMVKGTTYEFTFRLKYKVNGVDVYLDLSGGTVYFTMKDKMTIGVDDADDSGAILKKDVTVTSGTTATITLTPTETKIAKGTYIAGITFKTYAGIIITPVNWIDDISVVTDPRQRS
jgi:hypothetical protein